MEKNTKLVKVDHIEKYILAIRGRRVILDADLAAIYGVKTKALNQAVKRNALRFPDDFMFQLTTEEKEKVVTNCDHLKRLKFSSSRPFVFTEHGAIMAANVLNSQEAISASVMVVRAFLRLREMLASNAELAIKLNALEKKYDTQFKAVFDAIRHLISPPTQKRKRIGFSRDVD